MKFFYLIILCFTISLGPTASAEYDKFNTYQWDSKSIKPWYEWWYYKVILPDTRESFYFVYGIVNPWDYTGKLQGTKSYVGMGDFKAKKIVENQYRINQFYSAYDKTLVEIDKQTATDQKITGQLYDSDGASYSWDISIQKNWAFNAMGWAIGKDITNIKWYPAQASASCTGTILSKGRLHQFINAPCYQDRNWGNSFPLWWTWIVSNHFKDNPDTVLAVGGGRPKYLDTNFPFEGVSIGLKHKSQIYHFRPNDFDNVKVDINFGKWEITASNKNNKIEISAFAPKESFMDLKFVTPTGEVFHDYETLTGEVTIKLYQRDLLKWNLIGTLYSDAAGIEYGEPETSQDFAAFFNSKKSLNLDKVQ